MKYLAAVCASFLIACTVVSVFPNREECRIYDDVLRLHVLAESDSEEDQALKLKVRDRVLVLMSDRLENCGTFGEAYSAVESMLGEIELEAEECVRENGCGYSVRAEIVRESYPRREYGDAVMPAGEYNSLKITIGSGAGHNWWCVLFPTLCTGFAVSGEDEYIAAGFTPEEYRIITDGAQWNVKFRILEILSALFE
ncbi:MAG: stage II sporulation protein R [Eubacteriales bacterium]